MEIKLKRVYEEALEDDGWCVLVDHIWPRGLTKEKAALRAFSENCFTLFGKRSKYHRPR